MDKVIALVLAGGSSTASYGVLVRNRAKAALPIAGQYRLVDFILSNLANSGIAHVGLIIQFLPASLIEHVGAGESWDYHAFGRSLKIMPPFVGLGT
ncbi:MAG: sugar phosphate nucleotidyltransferase, partial [bacterium]